ncbi:hypothetical protein [Pollutibacter soli]|uniref:hypothetical protein n=1 Tax=Pollutibacter soli TaxID=3034157 RepID=UPI0030140E0B
MKYIILLSVFFFGGNQAQLKGAWEFKEGSVTHTLVIIDDYFSVSSFDIAGKKFIQTNGGTAKPHGNKLEGKIEFNSADKSVVGNEISYTYAIAGSELKLTRDGKTETWKKTDDGTGPLAGNWKIIRRDGNDISNRGARKTIKLLSGKRFHWAAINTETGEFSGTGGGSYTFENGKYTEHIEFFSRDPQRVGASLSFDGKVEGKEWHHSGKSSAGNPVNEVWSR